jgi:hypothetical protein
MKIKKMPLEGTESLIPPDLRLGEDGNPPLEFTVTKALARCPTDIGSSPQGASLSLNTTLKGSF